MSFPLYHCSFCFLNLSTSEIQITASQISHSEKVTWNYRQPEQNFIDVICLNWPFFNPWELLSYSLHIFQFPQQMKYDLIYMLDHFSKQDCLAWTKWIGILFWKIVLCPEGIRILESWKPYILWYGLKCNYSTGVPLVQLQTANWKASWPFCT